MLIYITDFFAALWMVSCMMAPWLLFGFFAAGVLSVFFSPNYIYKHMGKPGLKSIFKAALFGVPLPICSCGVIPITVSLKKQGAGRGAAGSFLISTPQTGLDSFFATYAMLGWAFAIFRPIIAFITGIIGGLLMENFGAPKTEGKTENADDTPEAEVKARPRGLKTIPAVLHYGFIKLLGNISSALLIGLVLAAFIHLVVPPDFGAEYIQSDWLAMPAMLIFGIPLYVCSTASIPIAASLIVKGISPGAALVFLITGPATNIASITIMSKVLGKRAVVIYVITVAVAAIIAGYIFNLLNVNLPIVDFIRSGGKMEISLLQKISCIILFALMAFTILQRLAQRLGISVKNMPGDLEIEVRGMTCEHCAASISRALKHIDGILKLDININSGIVKINAETPDLLYPLIEKVITDAGFSCSLNKNDAEKVCGSSCCSDK
ncbi:MAG: SO_0444 family Cu/Zn efflux transporter [Victivallaceae bacterium]|nr:SO_0444 family Cu/Zn efflux transporter [Victivallaceae bacterium]